jgi:predicted lipoprotein with Yx(FWY)xxD motif
MLLESYSVYVLNREEHLKTILLMTLGLTIASTSFALELKERKLKTANGIATVKTLENGITVYVFDPDQGAPAPTCEDQCAVHWPAVVLTAEQESGLSQAGLGTIKRHDGRIQLTFKGRPVYVFFQDKVPGDAKGDGLGNVWHVIRK